jgi:hypothetical protein
METKRLIPYSVHLPEEIYKKLKIAAGERKASSLVRDAITLIIEGGTAFNSGYNKGLNDSIKVVESEASISGLVINGKKVMSALTDKISKLAVKEKTSGTKKPRGN